MKRWTEQELRIARKTYFETGSYAEVARLFGVTKSAARHAMLAHAEPKPERAEVPEDVDKLVELARKGIGFEALCDELGKPPGEARALIAKAGELGFAVQGLGDEVLWATAQPAINLVDIEAPAQAGPWRKFAVMSDLHFGSKYHLRSQLVDFVDQAYDAGVRLMFLPGDLLDGCYRHGRWELTHHGFHDQAEDFALGLPRRPGLSYVGISGNHDETFEKETGLVVAKAIEDVFCRAGRRDLQMLGARGATVRLRGEGDPDRGLVVEMWHPLKGPAYALSYKLQKKIEGYAPGQKPDVVLTGHWHQSVYVEARGIHAFSCGTFQGGGSAFSRALGGAPSIGGWIIEYALTPDGTVRRLRPERISYFENETPRELAVA